MLFYGLVISISCQIIATLIAFRLVRRTKYNVSWLLISGGFLLMAVRRVIEAKTLMLDPESSWGNLSNWLGISISVMMLLGTIFIKKIFDLQDKIELMRVQNENRILNAVITAEENARLQFAKELHDGIGPLLSGIKMSVSAIDFQGAGERNRNILENTEKSINESIIAVREISNNLSPHVLNNFGLLKALRNFTDNLVTGGIDILISSNIEDRRYDYNMEVIFYRVLCELINNTIKHSGAGRIEIDIYEENKHLEINYLDNGMGFDPENSAAGQQGMGLENIRSRIRSINGNISIFTQPGEGFSMKISVEIP